MINPSGPYAVTPAKISPAVAVASDVSVPPPPEPNSAVPVTPRITTSLTMFCGSRLVVSTSTSILSEQYLEAVFNVNLSFV